MSNRMKQTDQDQDHPIFPLVFGVISSDFFLKDKTKGFQLENRGYLNSYIFGLSLQKYEQTSVNVFLPLFLYDTNKPIFEILYGKYDLLSQYQTDTFTPLQIMRPKFDESFVDMVIQKLQTDPDDLHLDDDEDDPDKEWVSFNDRLRFISVEERREAEVKNPYVYYEQRCVEATGCAHYLRGCSIFCPQCNDEFMCEICHNDDEQECSTQLLPEHVKEVRCQKCFKRQLLPSNDSQLKQQDPLHCQFCNNLFSEQYCSQCKILSNLPKTFSPIFHCKKHNKCHTNQTQELHFECPLCNECLRIREKKNHVCGSHLTCCVCLGQFAPQETHKILDCSPAHRMHWDCYHKMKYGDQCPLCRKLIKLHKPDPTLQIAICADWAIRLKALVSLDLAVYKCIECSHVHCNIDAAFCPSCFYNNALREATICSDFPKANLGIVVRLVVKNKTKDATQVDKSVESLVDTDDTLLDRLAGQLGDFRSFCYEKYGVGQQHQQLVDTFVQLLSRHEGLCRYIFGDLW